MKRPTMKRLRFYSQSKQTEVLARRIASAIVRARTSLSLVPVYRLTSPCFLHNEIARPQEHVYWSDEPNHAMRPVNLAAWLRYRLFLLRSGPPVNLPLLVSDFSLPPPKPCPPPGSMRFLYDYPVDKRVAG
jgi:hypothetical protein